MQVCLCVYSLSLLSFTSELCKWVQPLGLQRWWAAVKSTRSNLQLPDKERLSWMSLSLSLCPCHLGRNSSCPLAQYQQLKIAELACVSMEPQFRTSFLFYLFHFLSPFSLSALSQCALFFSTDICSQIFHEEKKELINWGWNILKGKRREREAWKHPQKQRDGSATVRPWRQLSELVVNDSVGHFLTLKAAFVIKLLTQPLKKNNKKLT